MYQTSREFQLEVQQSHTAVARLDVDRNNHIETMDVLGGNVTIDFDGSTRRAMQVDVVAEPGFDYTAMFDLLDPLRSVFRPYRGVKYFNGAIEWVPLGVFYLSQLTIAETQGGPVWRLFGLDASSRCLKPLAVPFVIPSGSKYINVIPPFLQRALPGLDFRIGQTEWLTPTLVIREDKIPWTEARNLALANGQDLWVARDGVVETAARPMVAGRTVASFIEGVNATFWDPERSFDAEQYPNSIVVVGTNSAATNVRGVAQDLDPNSPTFIHGSYGERTEVVRSEYVMTNDQATQMARVILSRRLGPQDELEFSAVPNPALDEADTFTITRERMGLEDVRMLISRIEIPLLSEESMKIKGRRSIVVDDNAGAGNPPPDVPPDPGDVTPPPPPPPPPPEPEGGTVDLILISIGYEVWNGSTWVAPTGPLTVGQIFRPTSVAKNQGTATMPAGATSPPPGTQLDVAYFYSGDNTYITWSDQYTATLGPGASTTMAATGGDHPSNDNRPYFTAVAGTHTLTGQVNSYGPPRKTESDYSNNTRATTITVEGAGSPPAGPQDTIVWGNAGSVSLYASLINGTPVSGSMLLAHGIKGVVGMGAGNWWDPFYDDFFPDYVIAAGLYWSVGMHLGHSPKPTSSGNVSTLISQFTSLCASGAAAGAVFPTLDCEPYDGPDNMWNVEVSAVDAAALGTGIGNAILAQGWTRVALYTSSNASWPGSYNDELQWEVNGVHPYDTSKFPNFLTALCNTGVIVEHTDAAFHFGPQRSGFTWDTGCADTVARAEAFHPNMRGSIMYWPDIDEGGLAGGYDDGVTEAAAAASLAHSTGLIHLYQHHMGDPDYVSSNSGQTWFGSGGYLDEVLAGLT